MAMVAQIAPGFNHKGFMARGICLASRNYGVKLSLLNQRPSIVGGGGMSFLGEIKRRKVFQAAAVSAVVSWLIAQIASAIDELLNSPDWSTQPPHARGL
jgi:hypothetical protein